MFSTLRNCVYGRRARWYALLTNYIIDQFYLDILYIRYNQSPKFVVLHIKVTWMGIEYSVLLNSSGLELFNLISLILSTI